MCSACLSKWKIINGKKINNKSQCCYLKERQVAEFYIRNVSAPYTRSCYFNDRLSRMQNLGKNQIKKHNKQHQRRLINSSFGHRYAVVVSTDLHSKVRTRPQWFFRILYLEGLYLEGLSCCITYTDARKGFRVPQFITCWHQFLAFIAVTRGKEEKSKYYFTLKAVCFVLM